MNEWYAELIKIATSEKWNYTIVPDKDAWIDYYEEGFSPEEAIREDATGGV